MKTNKETENPKLYPVDISVLLFDKSTVFYCWDEKNIGSGEIWVTYSGMLLNKLVLQHITPYSLFNSCWLSGEGGREETRHQVEEENKFVPTN